MIILLIVICKNYYFIGKKFCSSLEISLLLFNLLYYMVTFNHIKMSIFTYGICIHFIDYYIGKIVYLN